MTARYWVRVGITQSVDNEHDPEESVIITESPPDWYVDDFVDAQSMMRQMEEGPHLYSSLMALLDRPDEQNGRLRAKSAIRAVQSEVSSHEQESIRYYIHGKELLLVAKDVLVAMHNASMASEGACLELDPVRDKLTNIVRLIETGKKES